MHKELKLVILEKGKVLDTVVKQTDTKPAELVKSLEEFQLSANAALTRLVENNGDTADAIESEDDEESEEDEIPVSPKKRKK